MPEKSRRAKYIPNPADIIWIDFDPTKGREIQKHRPALVVSSKQYNLATGFIVVCPITSTIRGLPSNVTLQSTKTAGQIVASQIRSLDITAKDGRKVKFIEKLPQEQFGVVAQIILQVFDFDKIFGW